MSKKVEQPGREIGNLFLFVVICCAVYGGVSIAIEGQFVALIVFGACVWLIAVVYPLVLKHLEKEIVDPVYYTLGIATVMLAFFANSDTRKVVEKKRERAELVQKQQENDLKAAKIESILLDPTLAFSTLQEQLKPAIHAFVKARDQYCSTPPTPNIYRRRRSPMPLSCMEIDLIGPTPHQYGHQ